MVEFSYPCTTATSLCSPSLLSILLCRGSFWKLLICPALSAGTLTSVVFYRRKDAKAESSCSLRGVLPKTGDMSLHSVTSCWFSVAGFCQGRGSGSLRTVSFLKVYGVRNLYQPELPVISGTAREQRHIANQIALCWPWQRALINCWLLQA